MISSTEDSDAAKMEAANMLVSLSGSRSGTPADAFSPPLGMMGGPSPTPHSLMSPKTVPGARHNMFLPIAGPSGAGCNLDPRWKSPTGAGNSASPVPPRFLAKQPGPGLIRPELVRPTKIAKALPSQNMTTLGGPSGLPNIFKLSNNTPHTHSQSGMLDNPQGKILLSVVPTTSAQGLIAPQQNFVTLGPTPSTGLQPVTSHPLLIQTRNDQPGATMTSDSSVSSANTVYYVIPNKTVGATTIRPGSSLMSPTLLPAPMKGKCKKKQKDQLQFTFQKDKIQL